jgi:hypothetical protein
MAINSRASLDRSPKKNWVENSGGLPMYIRRIANHLHQESGKEIGVAIAIAVNAAKRMCSSGDLNFPGVQHVNAKSQAEACAAVAEWEKKKASARVAKGMKRKLTDAEYGTIIAKNWEEDSLSITSDEFEEAASWFGADDGIFKTEHEITKVDEDKQLVFGWASIGYRANGEVVVDRQGDVLDDVGEIEKSAYDFVVSSRVGGEMHIRKGVGEMVESFVSTPEKWTAMGIPPGTLPIGWWVGFRVTDGEVWKAVKSGKYKMFSVHGRGHRKVME